MVFEKSLIQADSPWIRSTYRPVLKVGRPRIAQEAEVSQAGGNDRNAVLQLVYQQAIQERDRLRGARAFFARQLGPLPAFAGISAAAVAAFSDKIQHRLWMWIAVGGLGLLVVVSMFYSGMPSYRHLRAKKEKGWRKDLECHFQDAARSAKDAGLLVEDMLTPTDWYIAQIKLERALYGPPSKRNRWRLPSRNLDGADLQDQLDRERTGLFVAQFLFLVVIVFLLVAHT